tara:strand:+ start:125263 stop:125460 length:198 start_codon:yes stop_codon:yes gene_type:complete
MGAYGLSFQIPQLKTNLATRWRGFLWSPRLYCSLSFLSGGFSMQSLARVFRLSNVLDERAKKIFN